MNTVNSRLQHQQRGAVLVEMAMILPLLALLLIGVVNMGLQIRDYQIVQNAAREGARFSALLGNQIAQAPVPADKLTAIQQRVLLYLPTKIRGGCSVDEVKQDFLYPVIVNGATVYATGSKVTVRCTRPMLIGSTSLTLVGESVFRNEY